MLIKRLGFVDIQYANLFLVSIKKGIDYEMNLNYLGIQIIEFTSLIPSYLLFSSKKSFTWNKLSMIL